MSLTQNALLAKDFHWNPSEDSYLDRQLLAQPSIEKIWEELVVAESIVVNYIGNLMVLSSKRDFPFTLSNPNHVYQYITHPNSFRHTLEQVANKIYTVFMNTHINIDQIQLNTQQIPEHLRTIRKLLTSASPRLVQTMLPIALGNIEQIAKERADSANVAMKYYQNVTLLLHEVTLATIDTCGIPTRSQKRFIEVITAGIDHGINGGALGGLFGSGGSQPAPPPIDNTAFNNAKEVAQLALENLKKAEAEYDKWYTQMLEKQNKLTGIIMQMSQLQMDQTDCNKIIDILVSTTKEIGEIQNQWTQITGYFSMLAIKAETIRKTILHEFIEYIQEVTSITGDLDIADRQYFVKEIQGPLSEIEQDAHLFYIMSKTYYDVSKEYIMPQMSNISKLLLSLNDDERQSSLIQIAQNTLSTFANVSQMALERKQQYEQRNLARQEEYNRFLQEIILAELQSGIGK